MIEGAPKFGGLAVGEFTCSLLGATVQLKAKAAFVDKRTGQTHGWTEGSGNLWSTATLQKMRELVELMEADLARVHFDNAATAPTAVATDPTASPGLSGGIGEHLKGDGAQI